MDNLRVKSLSEFVGNDYNKQCLEMQIKAAKIRNKPLKNIIFQGRYGCGKTTLAGIVAGEMGGSFHNLNAASITKKKHIFELACKIKEKDVVFIDEIHRLDISLEEMLYPIMEDNILILPKSSSVDGQERQPFTKIDIPPFTLIGATTDIGLLSGPFLSRFTHQYFVEPYTNDDIAKILSSNAKKLRLSIDEAAIIEIANRSRHIPRIANSRLFWIQDFALAKGISKLTKSHIIEALHIKQIDELGLEPNDRKYLSVLNYHKPLGLKTISSMTGLTEDTITKYIEPFLIAIQQIEISPRGRLKFLSQEQREGIKQQSDDNLKSALGLLEDLDLD